MYFIFFQSSDGNSSPGAHRDLTAFLAIRKLLVNSIRMYVFQYKVWLFHINHLSTISPDVPGGPYGGPSHGDELPQGGDQTAGMRH